MLKKFSIIIFILMSFALSGCVPDMFKFTKELGNSGSGRGKFLSPTDMDLTKSGKIVVADSGNSRIQVLDSDGKPSVVAGESGTKGYKLRKMSGIGVNPITEDVWVCDQRGNKLVRFSSLGRPNLKVTDKVKYPMDVAVARDGSLFVLMTKDPNIYAFTPYGKFIKKIGGSGKAAFIYATSIVWTENNLYVADYGGKRVVKLTHSGKFVAEFKEKGEYESMKGPSRIFVDENENIYLLDLGEVPVVLLDSKGELISKIGEFGNEKGKFLYPNGIVARSPKEILVLDNSRNCILKFEKKPE